MPYPLDPEPVTGARVRVLPPEGCPGLGEWVVPHEVPRWLELGFRLAPVPQDELELAWMPSPRRWDEPVLSRGVVLTIKPRSLPPQAIQVNWGDGATETVPWSPFDRTIPEPRHLYAEPQDMTVTVQIGILVATLEVALLACPLPVTTPRPPADPQVGAGMVLMPGAGIDGDAYDGSTNQQWQLRLHPEGGLGLMPSPVDGQPALVAMFGAGAASRGVRWYAGNGPPTTPWQNTVQPPPAAGDFYLDRLSGTVYELTS